MTKRGNYEASKAPILSLITTTRAVLISFVISDCIQSHDAAHIFPLRKTIKGLKEGDRQKVCLQLSSKQRPSLCCLSITANSWKAVSCVPSEAVYRGWEADEPAEEKRSGRCQINDSGREFFFPLQFLVRRSNHSQDWVQKGIQNKSRARP